MGWIEEVGSLRRTTWRIGTTRSTGHDGDGGHDDGTESLGTATRRSLGTENQRLYDHSEAPPRLPLTFVNLATALLSAGAHGARLSRVGTLIQLTRFHAWFQNSTPVLSLVAHLSAACEDVDAATRQTAS